MSEKTIPAKPIHPTSATRPASVKPVPLSQLAPQRDTPPETWAYWPEQIETQPELSSSRRQWIYGIVGGLFAVSLALILVAVAGLGAWLYRSDYIAPGVSIDGLDIGGYTAAEARTLLQKQWTENGILLISEDGEQAVVPETLGLSLKIDETVELAHQQGRSVNSFRRLLQSEEPVEITAIRQFDLNVARQNLQTLAPQFEIPPVDATIRSVDGQIEAVPAVAGRVLDINATLNELTKDPMRVLSEGRLSLITREVEAEITDVSRPVAEAKKLLNHSIAVRAYDPVEDEALTWTIEPDDWNYWLRFELDQSDPADLNWSVDTEKVGEYLLAQNKTLGPERYLDPDQTLISTTTAITGQTWQVEQRLYHNERQHTVQYGETLSSIGYDYGIPYPWIEEANPGINDGLTPGQVITIPSPDLMLPLPAVEDKRVVISLSKQKMWAYENDETKWEWPVSTGIRSSPTAPGIFQVQSHEPNAYAASWNLWMPNFVGIYRPSPVSVVMNGFHGFPTRNGSTLLWTDDLGHPVTYGCILIDSKNAAQLYQWAEAGVVVEIQP